MKSQIAESHEIFEICIHHSVVFLYIGDTERNISSKSSPNYTIRYVHSQKYNQQKMERRLYNIRRIFE